MHKRSQLSHLSHCYLGLYYLQMTCALHSLCNYIAKLFIPRILTTHMYGNHSMVRSFENIKLLCHSLNILQQFTLHSVPHEAYEIMFDHILHLCPPWLSTPPTTHVFFPLLEAVKLILDLPILQLLFALPETLLSSSLHG